MPKRSQNDPKVMPKVIIPNIFQMYDIMMPNFNRQPTNSAILDFLLVVNPKDRPNASEARQYLEENGHKPGRCLNPGALAGNLDTTRLIATWFFEDAPKSTNRKAAPAKKGARTTKDTNKGS